ncbi:phosphate acetyltransferase [Enterobacteriaceae endosymbiont of Donacia bicoloricornis]|uniref:phosphate acetyltransferase n=1 Tax=Enterobacteriaceae endosymbiont of Donacia bicoloricornis TaxID=2675772 RepID=UPI001449A670|nr:phosphate acetyltransferase [Enterobacteriaceae endosymbiont of Donacia bicoloricornis]QJC37607.1 phosphate acetyltransferase [Enterobacteriaceae endosymbiont of Donacia bicoloricornis]
MPKIIMSIPINIDIHFFTSINIGLLNYLNNKKLKCKFFKPISEIENYNFNYTNNILKKYNFNIKSIDSLKVNDISLLTNNTSYNNIIEKIIEKYFQNIQNTDIILIEGIIPFYIEQILFKLNCDIANIFNAKIIFVKSMFTKNETLKKTKSIIDMFFKKKIFDLKSKYMFSFIKELSNNQNDNPYFYKINMFKNFFLKKEKNIINNNLLLLNKEKIIHIPWLKNFVFGIDLKIICTYLNCVLPKNLKYSNIKYIIFFNNQILIDKKLFIKSLVIISIKDRIIIKKIYDMFSKKIFCKAILFTDFIKKKFDLIVKKISKITNNSIYFLYTKNSFYKIYLKIQNFDKNKFPINDIKLIMNIINYINIYIPSKIYNDKKYINYKFNNSPFIFKYNLINKARKLKKTILLPEGDELRTLKAAAICSQKNIAKCILLGNKKEIINLAKINNISLNENINIIEPKSIRNNYIEKLMYIRKNKFLNKNNAIKLLQNNMFLATMMLKNNEVDGIVSGARATTADTIRPALQIIKTLPEYSIISSIFIMLLPENVLIFSDCAINPNPNYKQLAEIAIQSAKTSKLLNIKPKIAMISYSTGNSSQGTEVEKVYKATKLVQNKLPNLIIDGPLQYDAAVIKSIGKYKAPKSLVAGKANIIIFPDLNTGNTTYKAVQRTSKIISIGPILQGIKKPINDLSRGSSIEDIIYTIAVTVIQSESKKK